MLYGEKVMGERSRLLFLPEGLGSEQTSQSTALKTW